MNIAKFLRAPTVKNIYVQLSCKPLNFDYTEHMTIPTV